MPIHKTIKARGRPLGQHFLFDRAILNRIADAADLGKSDAIVEVGPGLGTLTECLAERAGKVVAVELDASLADRFRERTARYDNVELIHADILKVDLNDLWLSRLGGAPFKVVANLPYYITTPIIMRFLESGLPVKSLTIMVQKEVAERLAAKPGGRDYGAISVAVQFRSAVSMMFTVPAGAFSPPPRVESAVLRIDMREKPAVEVKDEALFQRLVRGCFSQRRKTLRNNVSAAFGLSGEEAARLAEAAGIDPADRAERLGLAEFAALSDRLSAEGFRAK